MAEIFDLRARQWHLFGPPARPSVAEVAQYGRLLDLCGPFPEAAMVLGCTPELRGLLHERGIHARCLDRSRIAFNAMAVLKERNGPESFQYCEWENLPISPAVDLVLGDGSFNMLPQESRQKLARRLAECMTPGAHLLIRMHLTGPQEFESPPEVVAFWRNHPTHGSLFTNIRTDLDMLWLHPATGALDLGEYGAKLRQLYAVGILSREEWNEMEPLVTLNQIVLHYTTEEEMRDLLLHDFELLGTVAVSDYPRADLHPIWHLQRRQ